MVLVKYTSVCGGRGRVVIFSLRRSLKLSIDGDR